MAINKNFVIKNGIQVSTDLIIGDTDNNKVGIGTTIPGYDLHVGVARGSRGGIGATDIVVTGVGTIANLSVTGPSTFAGALDVNSTVDFAADVVFNGTNDITYDQSESALVFNDGAAIRVGTSSDFSIMHDGSDTILRDNGTGDLKLYGSRIEIGGASVDETIAFFTENAGAQLYFNNEEKFQTVAIGATIFGDFIVAGVTTTQKLNVTGVATVGGALSLPDNTKAQFGTGGDLLIYHDSSNSYIDDQGTGDLIIRGSADIKLQSASGENYIIANDTGSVEAYFDNSKKLETTSGGLNVTGITTFSDRINVVSGVSTFQDDAKLTFGAQTDLLIQHDGTDTEIYNKTGNLKIRANDLDIQDYTNGHSMITADRDGSVDLFYDNYNALQTTPQGINVSGVTTSNRLNISGVSTFTSIGSNLIPDTDGSRNIGAAGSEWQDLHIDGTANIDTLDVDATSNFADDVTLVAAGSSTILFDASAHQVVFQDNIRAKFGTGSDLSIFHDGSRSVVQNGTGNLDIVTGSTSIDLLGNDGSENLAKFVPNGAVELYYDNSKKVETTSGGLNVTGITTISDRLQVTSGISTFYDTTQSTSATTGAVIINGGVGIAKNVNIGGNLTVTGTTTLNGGTVTLGDADTDNVVFSADVDSNIIPDDDDTYDLGSSTKEWQDLFIDGTANIDTLAADTAAIGDLTSGRVVLAGTSGELEDSNNLRFDGGNLVLTGDIAVSSKVTAGTAATIFATTGNATFAGIVTANGGLLVGAGVTVGGDILPDADGSRDLGSATLEFQDLFIDGTANIDALVADTAKISDLTNNRVVLSGADGELTDNSELTFNSSTFNVGTGVTIQSHGGVSIAGITTIGGNVSVDGTVGSTGNITITNAEPTLNLTDSNNNSDFAVRNNDGTFGIRDTTNGVERLTVNSVGDVKVGSGVTFQQNGGVSIAGISTLGGQANAVGGVHCSTDGAGNGIKVGAGEDLIIQHNGTNSFIDNNTGDLYIQTTGSGDDILIEAADDFQVKVQGSEVAIDAIGNGEVILYHNANARITTTDDGADFGGTGSIRVPNGTTGERNSSPQAGDFRYNTTDGKFEGYTTEWGEIGGSGGIDETDTSVSTTSATSCGSFAIASFRSASIIAQITQGSNYQVGRYLVIHNGTTVTTIEESAVATGSMLGTFEGVINSSNLEFRVTMGSSSSATVTTKIDTVTV